MRRHNSILTTIIIVGCGFDAAPATDTPPLSHELDSVEVTASAPKRLASTAPVYGMTDRTMKIAGVTDIADAMRRLPGVNLRDYGGAGGLKTISVRGFGSQHTSVIYDGVALSDVQTGQIDLSRYSLDNVGSLSMLIGDNDDIFIPAKAAASPATLSISTPLLPDADTPISLTAQLRCGAWGLVNPYFTLGVRTSEQIALSATADWMRTDNNYPFTLQNGNYTSRERRNNSNMSTGHGELNLQWDHSSRSQLTAKAYYYDSDRRLPGPVIHYNNVSNERLKERNAFGQMRYRNVFNSQWSLGAIGKFNYSSSFYHDEDGQYPGGVLDENYWQREAYASAYVLYLPADRWAIDYSADYMFNSLNSNLSTDTRPYRHSILQSLTGRYRYNGITVMGRMLYSLYLNGSHTDKSADDASRLSPSVSLAWQPWHSQTIFFRLSYKNIFRMPSFNEAYFNHYGTAVLKPEVTNQFNAGITWGLRPSKTVSNLSVTVDGYINRVTDKIVAIPYNMFLWTMTNLGKVRILGVDATFSGTISLNYRQSLTLLANYSYQRAQPRTSPSAPEWMKQVAYTPKNSGSVSLSYENPWANLSIHTTAVSARYSTNANVPSTRIAGYADTGITIWRQFALRKGRSIELRGDILNLFDEQYQIVARYPMPGRSWQFTIKYHH